MEKQSDVTLNRDQSRDLEISKRDDIRIPLGDPFKSPIVRLTFV
jgi:hypothetical protein